MGFASNIPQERSDALLTLAYDVILLIRNCGDQLSREQIFELMDAIHNIPLYLQSSEEFYWDLIQSQFQDFDHRFAGRENEFQSNISLVRMFAKASERVAQ